MVRAKFKLGTIHREEYGWPQPDGTMKTQVDTYLHFDAVSDQKPENQAFTKATPSGTLKMKVDNPDALAQFEAGRHYFLDFSPADVAK